MVDYTRTYLGRKERKNIFLYNINKKIYNYVNFSLPNMQPTQTLVIIKPDANARQHSEIVIRFENRGMKLIKYKQEHPYKKDMEEHYMEHKGKEFFEPLIEFMTSGPCTFIIWESNGEDAVTKGRKILEGIRKDMRDPTLPACMNLCHASDSKESAEREIKLWFPENE